MRKVSARSYSAGWRIGPMRSGGAKGLALSRARRSAEIWSGGAVHGRSNGFELQQSVRLGCRPALPVVHRRQPVVHDLA